LADNPSSISDNIHLEPYDSEDDFYIRIYPKYMALLASAERFVIETEASPDRTTVIVR
jgi:histone deacetylase HOS3